MKEDLREVFVIIKGSYSKRKPLITFGEESFYIGGYEPEGENTKEWYRVIDRINGNVIHAGNSLNKALNSIKREIIRCKDYKGYINSLSEFSLGDGYLERERNKCLCEEYGWYYSDLIEMEEDKAYAFLKDNTDVKKAKRRFKKIGTGISSKKAKEKAEKKEEKKQLVLHKIKLAR